MDDPVNHPAHYTSTPVTCRQCGTPVECIDIAEHLGFSLGNAVKYIWRDGLKEGADAVTDLEKASWYVNREIGRLRKLRESGT